MCRRSGISFAMASLRTTMPPLRAGFVASERTAVDDNKAPAAPARREA